LESGGEPLKGWKPAPLEGGCHLILTVKLKLSKHFIKLRGSIIISSNLKNHIKIFKKSDVKVYLLNL